MRVAAPRAELSWFAVVYEGELGEKVSGGALAAPIAAGILKGVYDDPSKFAFPEPELTSPPIIQTINNSAPQVIASSPTPENSGQVAIAKPVTTSAQPPPSQPIVIAEKKPEPEPTPFPQKTNRRGPVKSIVRGIFRSR